MVGIVAAKSVYVAANHHTRQFDAWNIGSAGLVSYQATYTLQYSTDPAGIAIDAVTSDSIPIMFISSEFSGGVEIVNPVTLEYIGVSTGPSNLAGLDVDDVDDIVYALRRQTRELYIYQWDPVSQTMTQLAVVLLPGMSWGYGIALNDSLDVLWVTDTPNGMVRAYDVNVTAWSDISEVPSLSFSVPHSPVDITVDGRRNLVFTVAGWADSPLLTKYDVASQIQTTVNCGGGIGVAVDEMSGYVYITRGTWQGGGSMDDIQVWDCSTSPFTLIQQTPRIGDPAGLAIGNVAYNPLNLAKNDQVQGYGVYIGQTFPYLITYDNYKHDFDVTGVMVRDDLPEELDFISEMMDGVPGTGVYDPSEHAITWDVGTISAGQPGPDIELVVRVNQNAIPGTTIYNQCNIWCDQFDTTTVPGIDPEDPEPGPGGGTDILPSVPVAFDIKPTSCPNPINIKPYRSEDLTAANVSEKLVPYLDRKPNAVLPAAILGTADFDVSEIDPATLMLEGVPVLRWSIEDVGTPVNPDAPECECNTLGGDGYTDLTLKFDMEGVVATLGEVYDGNEIALNISGQLYDGTEITGSDCVIIRAERAVDGIFARSNEVPESFELKQNYPNPFNPETEIVFDLPKGCQVKLEIFNITGQRVAVLANRYFDAGSYSVIWNAVGQTSGVYFYRIATDNYIESKKMILLK